MILLLLNIAQYKWIEIKTFALKVKGNTVYVGITCTGESTVLIGSNEGVETSLNGYVFAFDATSNSFNTTPILDFPMSNPPAAGMWSGNLPWKPDFVASPAYLSREPCPWFFKGEDMLIALRNRSKDQNPSMVLHKP